MKQVIVLKLLPDERQYGELTITMTAFNDACNFIAPLAFQHQTANKIRLYHIAYAEVRERFGLGSRLTDRAISKVAEAYKRDKKIAPVFKDGGSVVFDDRVMSFKGLDTVSLGLLNGRELIPIRYGAYQAERMDRIKGQADLILRDGTFYLHVTIDLPDAPPADTSGGTLGIDLGIVEIATDSDGMSYSGSAVMAMRRKVKQHRRDLQKKRTRSAFKRLQSQSRRQSRYVRDVNHCISKELVNKALADRKALSMEALKGILERVNGFRRMRWLLGNWSFAQLQAFISYKAQMAGIPVAFVDPAYTSQTCSECGHCERANRPSQSRFKCKVCGLEMNADVNAARNIRARAVAMPPNVPLACQ